MVNICFNKITKQFFIRSTIFVLSKNYSWCKKRLNKVLFVCLNSPIRKFFIEENNILTSVKDASWQYHKRYTTWLFFFTKCQISYTFHHRGNTFSFITQTIFNTLLTSKIRWAQYNAKLASPGKRREGGR